MDEDITLLNQCQMGTLQATVWETANYDEFTGALTRGYLFQVTGNTGSIQFGIQDVEDFLSVLKTTFECARDHAKEESAKAVDNVLAALCDAESSHANP